MQVIEDIPSAKRWCRKVKLKGQSIGFVPTMGALHKGHLFLIQRARKDCGAVVVSIFVNPLQFRPGEDFDHYPRDLLQDVTLCEREGVDLVFTPSAKAMYPEGFSTWVKVEGKLTQVLEGAHRPGHFQGVTTVVAKLFNIVLPDVSFFGEKDYQQALLVKKMTEELNIDTQIVLCPTVREKDGLACSSRNNYLNSKQRKAATVLYRSLLLAKTNIEKGEDDPQWIISCMDDLIRREPLVTIDYIAVVDPKKLEPVKRIKGKVFVALAAGVGKTRLIDGMII